MPRYRREVEVREPRDQRIIIYCTRDNKKRWEKAFIDMDERNYEEALMKLIDLYYLAADRLGVTRLDDVIEKLRNTLESTIKITVAN